MNILPTKALTPKSPLNSDDIATERISKFGTYEVKERTPVKIHSLIAMIDPIPQASFDLVMSAFSNAGYNVYKICGRSRKREILYVRYALIHHLLNSVTPKMSLKAIGQVVGGRDHATVMNARKVMKDLADTGSDGDILKHIDKISTEIKKIVKRDSELRNSMLRNKLHNPNPPMSHAV